MYSPPRSHSKTRSSGNTSWLDESLPPSRPLSAADPGPQRALCWFLYGFFRTVCRCRCVGSVLSYLFFVVFRRVCGDRACSVCLHSNSAQRQKRSSMRLRDRSLRRATSFALKKQRQAHQKQQQQPQRQRRGIAHFVLEESVVLLLLSPPQTQQVANNKNNRITHICVRHHAP